MKSNQNYITSKKERLSIVLEKVLGRLRKRPIVGCFIGDERVVVGIGVVIGRMIDRLLGIVIGGAVVWDADGVVLLERRGGGAKGDDKVGAHLGEQHVVADGVDDPASQ